MSRIIRFLRIAFPIFLTGCGIIYAGHIYAGYRKGQLEYKAIEAEYTHKASKIKPNGIPEEMNEEKNPLEDTKEMETEREMSGKHIWEPLTAELPTDAPGQIGVNWRSLKERNEDVVGWIQVPAVGISYPILQVEDNEYYLHRDIDREYLYAGSIFMDAYNTPSMYNYNTIIYGHNMRDGSMFAGLRDLQSKEKIEQCRYFWVYTPEASFLYNICSIHYAEANSPTFILRFTDFEEYLLWQNRMISLSDPPIDIHLDHQDRIVTLSTCTESADVRMTVQRKLIWKREF